MQAALCELTLWVCVGGRGTNCVQVRECASATRSCRARARARVIFHTAIVSMHLYRCDVCDGQLDAVCTPAGRIGYR